MPKAYYITVLLYNDAGYKLGLQKYKNLKNPERFWLTMTPGYLTNDQMDDILEELEHMFDAANAGTTYAPEYDWAYTTPGVDGLYLYPSKELQVNLAQVENDLLSNVTTLATEHGFKVISDVRTGLPYQFQQIKLEKI